MSSREIDIKKIIAIVLLVLEVILFRRIKVILMFG